MTGLPDGIALRRLTGDASAFAPLTFGQYASRLNPLEPETIAIGALADGVPVGLVLGEIQRMDPDAPPLEGYLQSVLVLGRVRRQGIGLALLEAFAAAAAQGGAVQLRARHADFIPGRAGFEAALHRAGWEAPVPIEQRFHWRAGEASAAAAKWRSLAGRLLHSPLYRCEPWRPLDAADQAAAARLMAQEGYHPSMDFPRYAAEADPSVSLILRRGPEMVGWVLGGPMAEPPKVHAGHTVVYYPSAYVDEALWSTGFLIAGYWHACRRQAEIHGPQSIGMFDTVTPRKQMILQRRLAVLGFRVDEKFETRRGLGPAITPLDHAVSA